MPYNLRDIEVESSPQNPFKGDKLKRQNVVETLFQLSNNLGETGCVLALNGDWGAGKTTVVNMWRNYIASKGGKSLYFNAWETDYIEDPLVALVGELKAIFPDNNRLNEVVNMSGRVLAKVFGAVVKGGVRKLTGVDCDAIEAGIEELNNICVDKIKEYDNSKAEIINFKKALQEFIASVSSDYPVIFFIDELDRCNPHYAVKVLERVKHLFDVPNMVFVVATNINLLQYAIQGFYGSTNIDGKEYLRRFIDLEYTLPSPNIPDYVEYLYDLHNFSTYFDHNDRRIDRTLHTQKDSFKYLAVDLLSNSALNLRAVNKIMAYIRLAINTFPIRCALPFDLIFLLCFLKFVHPTIYENIKNRKYSLQQLCDELEQNLSPAIFVNNNYSLSARHILMRLPVYC